MLKDIVYKAISTAGYKWTPRAYSEGYEMSRHLRDLFSSLNISSVIDVGANNGQFRNFLRRRCGFTGLIISFEPIKSLFQAIQHRAKAESNWLVYNCALGAVSEQKEFNIMEDPHFSSFLNPHHSGIDHPFIKTKNVVVRREPVEVRTLSEVLPEISAKHDLGKIYLKMDTQGYDFEVMRGAVSSLENVAALQTEVSVKPLYEGMITYSAALTELGNYGFEVTGLFPVERDRLYRVIEFDCVAVNVAAGKTRAN